MDIIYNAGLSRISDKPVGSVFSFDGVTYIKTALTNSPNEDYWFVALATGLRPSGETHRDIEYGYVKILKAQLHVSDA